MPNHVTNKVTVSGSPEEIKRFRDFVRYKENGEYVEDTDRFFCFNSIIPMPEILRQTESGSRQYEGERALQILEGKPVNMDFLLGNSEYWQKCGVSDAMSYARYIERERQESVEVAKLCRQAVQETGCKDWYDWAISHWGTKWDAYNQYFEEYEDKLIYTFDTAWSVPEPVYTKLFEDFTGLNFTIKYFDEGHGFWGVLIVESGDVIDWRDSIETDHDELCVELKGYGSEEEEEDE